MHSFPFDGMQHNGGETTMIDEELTMEKYGYYSTDLTPKNGKRVVAVCDGCGAIRYLKKHDYRDLCPGCSHKGIKHPPRTSEHRMKISEATTGKKKSQRTDEHCKRISAGHQGIPYEDWTGFIANGEYCEKFDEACRERIREKYYRKCFLCDKPEDYNITKNGKQRLLAVHHYDMNKDQGCNGNLWKLVPLCMCCHGSAHSKILTARIEYLLENVWTDQNV